MGFNSGFKELRSFSYSCDWPNKYVIRSAVLYLTDIWGITENQMIVFHPSPITRDSEVVGFGHK